MQLETQVLVLVLPFTSLVEGIAQPGLKAEKTSTGVGLQKLSASLYHNLAKGTLPYLSPNE
jgi:hypothetical protein